MTITSAAYAEVIGEAIARIGGQGDLWRAPPTC